MKQGSLGIHSSINSQYIWSLSTSVAPPVIEISENRGALQTGFLNLGMLHVSEHFPTVVGVFWVDPDEDLHACLQIRMNLRLGFWGLEASNLCTPTGNKLTVLTVMEIPGSQEKGCSLTLYDWDPAWSTFFRNTHALILTAVHRFQDCRDDDPMIRGLALRSLCLRPSRIPV